MRARRVDVLVALSTIGVAIAAYLTFVALDQNVEAFCTGVGDCHRVQNSEYARVAGVPVAALGLVLYATLLALSIARRVGPTLPGAATRHLLGVWTFALALAGVLYSAYLTYLELFVIDAICAWCVASAVLITAIAVVAAPDIRPSAGDAGR